MLSRRTAIALFGGGLLAAGGRLVAKGARAIRDERDGAGRYELLAREVDGGGDLSEDDWTRLGPHGVAWLSVGNTPIDYPVAQATQAAPNYFLTHDLWGADSSVGCPFVDHRTSAEASHVMVLAHRLGTSDRLFGELRDRYVQERFDELGGLLWATPASGSTDFFPLCAAEVDRADPLVQRFGFDSVEGLRGWAAENLKRASARAPDGDALAAEAGRVVTLVTCSSARAGQRQRAVVLFVSPQEAGEATTS